METSEVTITGREIIAAGIPQGPLVGLGLDAYYELVERGYTKDRALEILSNVYDFGAVVLHPGPATSVFVAEVARIVEDQAQVIMDQPRTDPVEYHIYGANLVDPNAGKQMNEAMLMPSTVAGALMPDAHVGYGLPIGGVWATRNTVSPYAVGVDIACRMRLTVFDIPFPHEHRNLLKRLLVENTIFGAGKEWGELDVARNLNHLVYHRPGKPSFADPLWEEHPFFQRGGEKLRQTSIRQLGTSGGGNHFVEFGAYSDPFTDGERLALLSHSGSRGLGAKIANFYSELAMEEKQHLPDWARRLAWFDLDSEHGQEYWAAMELAGDYASENHYIIHRRLWQALAHELNGVEVDHVVENHHNFAWRQNWNGEDVVIHRKGATPVLDENDRPLRGVIPGSMTTPTYVVEGIPGQNENIRSASHGAGRQMGRKQAIRTLKSEGYSLQDEVKKAGVTLIGGSLDESPRAYKNIRDVIDAQSTIAEVVGAFVPKIVRMAND